MRRLRDAVEAVLEPLRHKVDAIVSCDNFWSNPEISDDCLEAVHYVQSRFYNRVSRFTTNGFARIQLAKGLQEHQVSSKVVGSMTEARRALDGGQTRS